MSLAKRGCVILTGDLGMFNRLSRIIRGHSTDWYGSARSTLVPTTKTCLDPSGRYIFIYEVIKR